MSLSVIALSIIWNIWAWNKSFATTSLISTEFSKESHEEHLVEKSFALDQPKCMEGFE
jgi:hypothetical protein